jgi:hypothetical protein
LSGGSQWCNKSSSGKQSCRKTTQHQDQKDWPDDGEELLALTFIQQHNRATSNATLTAVLQR